MKKSILMLLFMAAWLPGFTQFNFEIAYPEQLLKQRFDKAVTAEARIFSAGVLALNLVYQCKDSLGNMYIEKISAFAAGTNNPAIIARAIRRSWQPSILKRVTLKRPRRFATASTGISQEKRWSMKPAITFMNKPSIQ